MNDLDLNHYLCCRPAGLLQGFDQLILDSHGYLLVSPTPSVVLADIKPDQAPTIYIIPTNIPIVRGTIASHRGSLS